MRHSQKARPHFNGTCALLRRFRVVSGTSRVTERVVRLGTPVIGPGPPIPASSGKVTRYRLTGEPQDNAGL